MSIDPLARDYVYNSPYAFAENRVLDGREREGLEWTASTSSDGKTVTMNLNVKLVNKSAGVITNKQMGELASQRATLLNNTIGGTDSQGRTINVNVTYSNKATMVWQYSQGIDPKGVQSLKGLSDKDIMQRTMYAAGMTDKNGDTQVNRTQVNTAMLQDSNGNTVLNNETKADVSKTGAHEDGHTLGGKHEDNDSLTEQQQQAQLCDPTNLMNYGAPGNDILPEQRTEFVKTVQSQQKQ